MMTRVWQATILFTGVLLGQLMLDAPSIGAAGDPTKGKATYEKHCMACHGPQGKGDGPAGKMLKPPAADFTSAESKKKPVDDIRRIIEDGKAGTAMTAWKAQLSSNDITDIVAYVDSLRK
jgi:mono/diheme cytochrome c family protein